MPPRFSVSIPFQMAASRRNRNAGKGKNTRKGSNKKTGRDYSYDKKYQSSPEQKKKRAQRNAARAKMIKAGKAKVGDGKDVDHKKPLKKGGSNRKSNLRVVSQKKNRSRK